MKSFSIAVLCLFALSARAEGCLDQDKEDAITDKYQARVAEIKAKYNLCVSQAGLGTPNYSWMAKDCLDRSQRELDSAEKQDEKAIAKLRAEGPCGKEK